MKTSQEIETAIQKLKPQEIDVLADWLAVYRDEMWDRQIEAEAKAGVAVVEKI